MVGLPAASGLGGRLPGVRGGGGRLDLPVPGKDERKRQHGQIGQYQDPKRNEEMLFSLWVLHELLLVFPEYLLIAIANDKDIIEKCRGQEIDGPSEDRRLYRGCKPGMPDGVQIDRLHHQKPSAKAQREQVHRLYSVIHRLSRQTDPVEIVVDIEIEIIYVFHRDVFNFRVSG
jgi:hypothetical protein